MAHEEVKRMVKDADTAVLLIHGIVGTPDHFGDFLPLIPKNMSVYNLLLDGHGKGVKDFAKTSMKKWEAQVEQAVDDLLANHEKLYIVAHSMGTLLAIGQAVKHKKVTGLFLLAVPIKLCLKPAMVRNIYKVYRDRIDPGDKAALAAKKCCGIRMDKNLFHYVGWIPRYLELFANIRSTRKLLPQLSTPCTAYQSVQDEMVAKGSIPYLKKRSPMRVIELKTSGHYCCSEEDYAYLLKQFEQFIGR